MATITIPKNGKYLTIDDNCVFAHRSGTHEGVIWPFGILESVIEEEFTSESDDCPGYFTQLDQVLVSIEDFSLILTADYFTVTFRDSHQDYYGRIDDLITLLSLEIWDQ